MKKKDKSLNKIEDIQKTRFQFMKRLYEIVEADELSQSNWVEIGKELGLDRSLANKITIHLMRDGLIEFQGNEGVTITHEGICEIEETLLHPNEPTSHFPPVNELLGKKEKIIEKQEYEPRYTELIKCRHCDTEVVMKVVREYDQVADHEAVDPQDPESGTLWTAGPVWVLALCPACSNITLLHYQFHDWYVDKGFETNILYPSTDKVTSENKEGIFPPGKQYDAYKRISEILSKAVKSIVIIDGFINEDLLDILTEKNPNVKVKILTHNISNKLKAAAKRFNQQHKNLSIRISNEFHDRHVIVDDQNFYHFGASIKDVGSRVSMFSRIEEPKIINELKRIFDNEWTKATIKIEP